MHTENNQVVFFIYYRVYDAIIMPQGLHENCIHHFLAKHCTSDNEKGRKEKGDL